VLKLCSYMKKFFSKSKFITLLSAIVLSVGFLSVYQYVFASITISSPSESGVGASAWAPSVSWGDTGEDCRYNYNDTEFIPIDCANNGSDIPPPPTSFGTYTLYVSTNAGTYNTSVTFDYFDDSVIPGCTDSSATNYNATANFDDGSCEYLAGCTDSAAINYDPIAVSDDGSCYYNPGCTDPEALNYDNTKDHDDGSCEYPVSGCMDESAVNYDPNASVPGDCYYNPGCTDPEALNYDSNFDYDDGSCEYGVVTGCTDPSASNYNESATHDDGSCEYAGLGCTDSSAINHNPEAVEDDGSCLYFSIQSPINAEVYTSSNWAPAVTWPSNASTCEFNYDGASWNNLDCSSGGSDISAPSSSGTFTLNLSVDSEVYTLSSTFEFTRQGCTDDMAFNYDSGATEDDGSCYYNPGCTDPGAINYNGMADYDDGSCYFSIPGCTDPIAFNYNASATEDDGSCYYNPGCTDPEALNYDSNADYDNGSCEYPDGCTDSGAINYDETASNDDGSCLYFSIQSPINDEVYTSLNWAPSVTWPSNASTCEFNYNGAGWSNLDCSSGGSDISAPSSSGTFTLNLSVDSGIYVLSSTFDFTRMTVGGCTDSEALNYSSNANQDDGSCYYESGCTDSLATNYNSNADHDDGTCEYDNNNQVPGCTDASATNYNASANTDDGSCEYNNDGNGGGGGPSVPGCTDASATNYNASANTDDGSCTFPPSGSGGGSSSPTSPAVTVAAGSRTGGGSSVSSSSGITGPNANTAIRQIQSNNTNSISPVFINLLQNRDKVLAINNTNNNSNSNGTNVTSPLAGIIGVINSDFQFSISGTPSNSITGNNQDNNNNEENLNLQRFLNSQGFIVNTNPDRPGSPGNETNVFGSLTRNALANFQRFVGIEPADGRFTPITRSFINGFLKSLEISQ
jgi:hypothetical protein